MKKFIIAALFYSFIILFVFGPALIPNSNQLIYGDDIHHQYYFYRQFFNSFLKQGVFPWWNPYNFSGTPFIANPVVNIWYPFTWLFVFLPINTAYSWHVAMHILIAMIGMYWLMRRWTHDVPAWISGLVFGLSGFFMARVWAGHVDVVAAASWMPWVVGTSLRYQASGLRKDAVIAASVFGLQLFSGYQTMTFFTVEAIGIISLIHCYIVKNFRPLVRVALVGILGGGLAGLQLVPEQEFFRRSIRTFTFPYSWISYGSLSIENLKQLLSPFYFGDQTTYHGGLPNYAEHALFVGRIPLVLVGIVFFTLFKKKTQNIFSIIAFFCIAFFGLWMSAGKYALVDLQKVLWQIIPFYHYLRIPSRHLVLFVFGVSALAGLGLERLTVPKKKIAELVIAGFILLELVQFAKYFIALKNMPETTIDPYLVQTLTIDSEPFRSLQNFGVWIPPRDSLDFDSTMKYRIFSATGYDPSILRNYYEFIDIVNGKKAGESILDQDVQIPFLNINSSAPDVLNIKYLLVPTEYDPIGKASPRFGLLKEDTKRDYRLYENKTVLPRFYFVPKIQLVNDRTDLIQSLQQGNSDFLHMVYAVNSPALHIYQSNCQGWEQGSITVVTYSPNSITLNVSSPCNGFLSTSEVYYPGWQATIDGKTTDVFEGNLAFRTIAAPIGAHTVKLFYNPKIFIIGAIVSILSVVGSIIFLLQRKK